MHTQHRRHILDIGDVVNASRRYPNVNRAVLTEMLLRGDINPGFTSHEHGDIFQGDSILDLGDMNSYEDNVLNRALGYAVANDGEAGDFIERGGVMDLRAVAPMSAGHVTALAPQFGVSSPVNKSGGAAAVVRSAQNKPQTLRASTTHIPFISIDNGVIETAPFDVNRVVQGNALMHNLRQCLANGPQNSLTASLTGPGALAINSASFPAPVAPATDNASLYPFFILRLATPPLNYPPNMQFTITWVAGNASDAMGRNIMQGTLVVSARDLQKPINITIIPWTILPGTGLVYPVVGLVALNRHPYPAPAVPTVLTTTFGGTTATTVQTVTVPGTAHPKFIELTKLLH
jgi:hypothetical protein